MSNAAATETSRADLPSFGSVNTIDAGGLAVGYAEVGPADGPAVILLHGWPRIPREARMQSLGSGDPARRRTDYYPTWLDNLADDVTVEGAAMDGAVQGAEDVRSLLVYARTLYDFQGFNFVGP